MNTEASPMTVAAPADLDPAGPFPHLIRVVLLMAATAALMGWTLRHGEASLRDGLRSIQAARQIDAGAWGEGLRGIEHPLHPLAIVSAHRLIGGEGPEWWQRAAVAASFAAVVLLVVPLYLVGRDLFGDRAAWLGCVLFLANPILGSVVVNVLSESTFLLAWTWGLWAAIRFLREGSFGWLLGAVGFGVLAYLARPEGLLLPASVLATMLLIPFHHATRINWPRWRRATALLVLGAIALAGPYIAASGTLTPRPGPARVLGLEPRSPAFALEREAPMAPGQTTFETYRLAASRMVEVLLANLPLALLAAAILGVATSRGGATPSRTWLFLAVLLAASSLALVRLHATAGYCSPRNALVPGMVLILVAARGIDRLMTRLTIPGRLVGLPRERLRPGPVVWAAALALIVSAPRFQQPIVETPGPFNVYWDAGRWLARSAADGEVLDLTDWSLYFSRLPGSSFAQVREAAADPDVRWVVALASQVEGESTYSDALRSLIGDREPVAALPAEPKPGQVQIRIFDREVVPAALADAGPAEAPAKPARR
ncbi:ArnT family glycosyltransferase [Paludisphaera soli]|uniref:ArnT family glycosyltransferase n=1 Tax=Paludisphaera soli TaxID=2712865 RepID=UPI0013EA2FCB|nr:glycosyltransferase family 39 protein [Paludisphaera soli]